MLSVEIDRLKKAVEKRFDQVVTFSETVPVVLVKEGQPLFQGEVHVFDLAAHPTAARAYAWWTDGYPGRLFQAVLHLPPIDSPHAAVEKAVMTRRRNRKGRGHEVPADASYADLT